VNQFSLPIFMSVGENLIEKLSSEVKRCLNYSSSSKIALITSAELLEIYSSVIENALLDLPEIEVVLVKKTSFDYAVELAKYISIKNIKIVIGFGGGAVLDTAKYASFVAKTSYIAVPTALSNEGLSSPIAVLYTQNARKKSFGSKIPEGIIIDTTIISKAPKTLLQAGVGDTASNYTALFDWKLDCAKNGTTVNDFSYMLSEMSFNALLNSPEKVLDSKEGITMVAKSLVISGISMEIAGNSRPCSGSEHLFSHAIDELYDLGIPHGILVALGSVAACVLQGRNKFILIDYLNAYGISVNPMKLGITQEHFVEAWLFAKETRKERFTILNTIDLSAALFNELYEELSEVCK